MLRNLYQLKFKQQASFAEIGAKVKLRTTFRNYSRTKILKAET